MPIPKATFAVIWANSGPTLLARIIGHDGEYIQQTDLSSIDIVVTDINDPELPIDEDSLVINDVVFNTLQTDSRWTADEVGFNFAYPMLATSFPQAGDYRVDIQFTPVSGEVFFAVFEIRAEKVYSPDL